MDANWWCYLPIFRWNLEGIIYHIVPKEISYNVPDRRPSVGKEAVGKCRGRCHASVPRGPKHQTSPPAASVPLAVALYLIVYCFSEDNTQITFSPPVLYLLSYFGQSLYSFLYYCCITSVKAYDCWLTNDEFYLVILEFPCWCLVVLDFIQFKLLVLRFWHFHYTLFLV